MDIEIESPSTVADTLPNYSGSPSAQGGKFVSFKLGENMYAVNASAVAEVTHPLPITPLPDQPSRLLGISPLRGDVLAVVDLRNLLSESPCKSTGPKMKQIVLKSSRDALAPIAFVVDRLGEIAAIEINEIRRSDSSEFIYGVAESNGFELRILNHATIANAIDSAR